MSRLELQRWASDTLSNLAKALLTRYLPSAHATEAGIPFPEVPILFIKGRQALAGPGDLPVPAAAQDDQLDYETELAVIIGKSCRDVKAEDALSYVLG